MRPDFTRLLATMTEISEWIVIEDHSGWRRTFWFARPRHTIPPYEDAPRSPAEVFVGDPDVEVALARVLSALRNAPPAQF